MTDSAVILAGGFGTRLQQVVKNVPKPMALVNGKPFLEYIMLYLKHYGITNIILSVGHLNEVIRDHFGTEHLGINIHYTIETNPLGTGGGIRLALEQLNNRTECFVLNGDSFFDIDLQKFAEFHKTKESDASLALRQVEDTARFGTISINEEERLLAFNEKTGQHHAGLINGGVYILKKEIYLSATPEHAPFSIEKDFFEKDIKQHQFFGKTFSGYFIDIGIPDDYERAQHEFKGFKY